MLWEIWRRLFAYLERQPYWKKVEPIFLVVLLYSAALILTYQYLAWRYHYDPGPSVFLRSYFFKQATVSFVAIGLVVFLIATLQLKEPGSVFKWSMLLRRQVVSRIA